MPGERKDGDESAPTWRELAFEDVELGDRIGGGGVGIVYQGWLGRRAVAIKTLVGTRATYITRTSPAPEARDL